MRGLCQLHRHPHEKLLIRHRPHHILDGENGARGASRCRHRDNWGEPSEDARDCHPLILALVLLTKSRQASADDLNYHTHTGIKFSEEQMAHIEEESGTGWFFKVGFCKGK